MSDADARRFLVMLWLGAIGLQVTNQVASAVQARKQATTDYLVAPHKLIASGFVFTVLFGLAGWVPSLAVATGVGLDVLWLLGPMVPGRQAPGVTVFDQITSLVKATA